MENGACGPVRPFVEKLNGKYNLGLYVSARDLRALDDAELQLQHTIMQNLLLHNSQGAHRLQSVMDRFDHKARERGAKRVHRPTSPYGSPQESSRRASPPQAVTPEDKVTLQQLLLHVLEEPTRETQRRPRAGLQSKRTAPRPEGRNGEPSSTTEAGTARRHRESRKKKDERGKAAAPENTGRLSSDTGNQRSGRRIGHGRRRDSDFLPEIDAGPSLYRDENSAISPGDTSPLGIHEPQEWDSSFWTQDTERLSSSPAASESSAMYSAMESLGPAPLDSQTTAVDDGGDDVFRPGTVTYPKLRRALSEESFGISESEEQTMTEMFDMLCIQQPPPGPTPETSFSSVSDMQRLKLSDDRGGVGLYEDDGGYGEPAESVAALVPGLQDRLDSVFPCTPAWLEQAPFPIVWEMTRIAMHCGVDLHDVEWSDPLEWESQDQFRRALSCHPRFAGKMFPERASQLAWRKAMNPPSSEAPDGQKRSSHYSADLSYNRGSSGPLFFLKLRPLAVSLPHRLGRHFGYDRFLEITMPSHDSSHGCIPRILWNHPAAVHQVNQWLTRQRHAFLGRKWAAFFIKDSDKKQLPKAKGDEPASMGIASTPHLKKVHFFSEEGCGILPPSARPDDTNGSAPSMKRHAMLDWLLQYNKHPENRRQPFLKLFSRIALGLSTTTPTIVFEPHQLRHQASDLLSPISGKVMNDGIGRMSLSVVRKLRSMLELTDLPTAVQGRLGCAKGMWILDTEDDGRHDWIETYPSQRKWLCDFADKDHRTLEVCKIASEVRSATLNSQFITVLEAQAPDKARLRRDLGIMLKGHIGRDLEVQRKALGHPMLLAAWVHETVDGQKGRVLEGQVPFLAGLPDSDAETIAFLLSGGFDPRRQTFLWDMVYKIQKARLETLKEKLNMPVGRSTYLFMAVDFLGVLEEGEVQVCFSTKFQAEEDSSLDSDGDNGWFSDTLLVNRDVLVARSPAHYTSDIQKVRAVYRPELSSIKDVIFFSSKGPSPLAEMLSGGDYDGDMAWVCWDPRLVNNFVNAREPSKMDLIEAGYMRQNRTTLQDLVDEGGSGRNRGNRNGVGRAAVPSSAVDEMIDRSFAFNMPRGLLGRLTKYKEDLCYLRDSVGDTTAIILSTALSQLVDRVKQGIEFTDKDFNRLRRECLQGARDRRGPPPDKLPMPAYQGNTAACAKGHILDYLKFKVILPVIKSELTALKAAASRKTEKESGGMHLWDADLAEPAKAFEELAKQSEECFVLYEALRSDLSDLFARSGFSAPNSSSTNRRRSGLAGQGNDDGSAGSFRDRVLQQYQEWCAILPRYAEAGGDRTVGKLLQQAYLVDAEGSQWALLRASEAYRMFYGHKNKTVWRLAGRQLQMIKGLMSEGSRGDGGGYGPDGGSERNGGLAGAKVLMTPLAYAATRPNKKIIQQIAARLGGTGVEGVDFDGPGDVDDA